MCSSDLASHGVYRPGGSALNAGQVGSTRAAQYIAARCNGGPDEEAFQRLLTPALERARALCQAVYAPEGPSTVEELTKKATGTMSRLGGAVRSESGLRELLETVCGMQARFSELVRIQRPGALGRVFRLRDILLCQRVYAEAMLDYLTHGGKSRGSALYTAPLGDRPLGELPKEFTFTLEDDSLRNIFRWYCTDIFSLHSPPSSAIKWAEGGIFYGMSKLSLRTDRAPQLSAAASEPAARLGVSDESTPYLGVRIVWPQAGWPHGPGHRRGQRDRARGDLRLCQRGGKGGHRLLSG